MSTLRMYQEIKPGHKPLKVLIVKIAMFIIGRAWQALYRFDARLRREVARWPDGFRVMFKVRPCGPYYVMEKIPDGTLRYRGRQISEHDVDLVIMFKNIEAGFLIFTAQLSIPQAYAEHRTSVVGNPRYGLSVVRSINIVETYLFPMLIARRTVKRPAPIPTVKKHFCRLWLYLVGIPFGL